MKELRPRRIRIAGVPVDAVDLEGAASLVDEFIQNGGRHFNIAINAAKVVEYQRDPLLREAIETADLLTADGQPIVWASRLLGTPIPSRAAGIDLMNRLFAQCAQRGRSVFLLGATDEVLSVCVRRLKEEHPRLRIAGCRNGYFGSAHEEEIVAAVNRVRPDVLLLGFGSPAKEYFMLRYHSSLDVPFVMGVGGSFDVYAGMTKRAPTWMQATGLEWLYRVLQEPRRLWKRYLVGNSAVVGLTLRDIGRRVLRQ